MDFMSFLSEVGLLLHKDGVFFLSPFCRPLLTTEHFIWAIDERNKTLADNVGAPKVS